MNKALDANMLIGIKQVTRALTANKALGVWLAEDADAKLLEGIVQLAKAQSVPIQYVPTMKALGRICQIDVGAAAAVKIK